MEKNHEKEKAVWIIFYKKDSGTPSVSYVEAVEQALCFGWIDSKANKRDDESYYQYFAKRNPKGKWASTNKARVEKLIAQGLMTPAGMEMIDLAKKTGTWDALNDVEAVIIPDDFMKALKKNKKSLAHWEAFPISSKKIILFWISDAKRPETRQKRIEESVRLAAENIKANHYRQ
ncbi:MAG TPA: YdeI/OmpD-associated family protein [Saprospiraceae bacterium]